MPESVTRDRVLIYSTPGCGRCQAARQFFESQGMVVEMINVAGDFAALRRMMRRSGGSRTVPVIEHCEVVVTGFDPAYWLERLGAAS